MKAIANLICFALLFPGACAFAETYTNDVLTLDVPAGFEGPTSGSPGPGAKVVAYSKPHAGVDGGTLFQITTYDFGSSLEGMPEEERGNASEHYLGQFLGGVERKRTAFRASPPERISLGGLPASRVMWTGNFNGTPVSGVMYCVVIGTTVVTLHTQDVDDAPPENRRAAMDAFEALRVKVSN